MLDDRPADAQRNDDRNDQQSRKAAMPAELRAPAAPSPTQSKPASKMTPLKRNLLGAAIVAAIALGGYYAINYWTVGRFQVTTDDAYVGVRAATLSPKVSGYVTEIAVADNATVKTGDLIARIDPVDYQLAVRSAEDQITLQRATIARIGQQIVAQQAMVQQARAQATASRATSTKAEADFKRQTDLQARQINSAATFEQAKANRDQAIANVAAADAGITAAIANVAVYTAQRLEAENVLKQNETSLAKTQRDLSFAEIRAPFDGVLGNRAMQVGDYVQPAQRLASLVPLKDVYIDANFKETQLSRLQLGQRVKITVDAHSERVIEGRIVSVAPASGSVFSLLPPDNATGNFTKVVQRVPVRIAVPADIAATSMLRAGMSVVVSVDTKAERNSATASR
jgi:membrane fusion protein, multidrug efflux system